MVGSWPISQTSKPSCGKAGAGSNLPLVDALGANSDLWVKSLDFFCSSALSLQQTVLCEVGCGFSTPLVESLNDLGWEEPLRSSSSESEVR